MGNLIPESLVWLNQIEGLKGQTTAERRAELKKDYNLSKSQITNLLAVKACFDQPAINKVRQAPFILSLNSAMVLAGLKGRVDDLPRALNAALDVTLARRLATKHIKSLVEWIVSGKPASEFDPKVKPLKKDTQKGKTEEKTGEGKGGNDYQGKIQTLDLKKFRQLLEKAEAERIQGNETAAQENLDKYLQELYLSPSGLKNASGSKKGFSETIVLDWLADVSLIAKIKSKVKKDKSLTKGEVAFLWLHKTGEMAGHGVKGLLWLFKPLLQIAHWVWKQVVEALKELGLYRYAKAIFTLVMVAVAIWFAWEAFHYGVMRPAEIVWSKIHSNHTVEEAPTPVPTPYDNGNRNELLAQPNLIARLVASHQAPTPIPKPVMAYQPSMSFNTSSSPLNPTATLYDQKILDSEIQSLPANYVVVKDYPMTPDESMPGDVAVSRMQDLIDPDKYTMMIGGSKQTISIANPTHTTLTIYFKSADLFGPLGGSKSPMNFLWEDVMYIHANEIDVETKNPSVIYQCSLVVSGSKYPLTIQCASAEDLEHLVSTMQYFIRSSRLAHDTALGGMPYLHQGLVLNDHWVEKLWAGSPMDKAGVRLGDLIWSLDKDTQGPQDAKKMLALLASLAGGNHQLFIYSPADPNNNGVERNEFHTGNFNPKRRKVPLQP